MFGLFGVKTQTGRAAIIVLFILAFMFHVDYGLGAGEDGAAKDTSPDRLKVLERQVKLLTGEVKHSTARWAEDAGFCVIDGGHFSTEELVVAGLAENIRDKFGKKEMDVEVLTTEVQSSPFKYYFDN